MNPVQLPADPAVKGNRKANSHKEFVVGRSRLIPGLLCLQFAFSICVNCNMHNILHHLSTVSSLASTGRKNRYEARNHSTHQESILTASAMSYDHSTTTTPHNPVLHKDESSHVRTMVQLSQTIRPNEVTIRN